MAPLRRGVGAAQASRRRVRPPSRPRRCATTPARSSRRPFRRSAPSRHVRSAGCAPPQHRYSHAPVLPSKPGAAEVAGLLREVDARRGLRTTHGSPTHWPAQRGPRVSARRRPTSPDARIVAKPIMRRGLARKAKRLRGAFKPGFEVNRRRSSGATPTRPRRRTACAPNTAANHLVRTPQASGLAEARRGESAGECLRRCLAGTSRDGCLRSCDGVMLSVWVGLFGVRCLLDWR